MQVQIVDVHPSLDGTYPLDPDTLTNREYHEIKRISGCRASELNDALKAVDLDVVVAFGLIALRRAGKGVPEAEDTLFDAEGGNIRLIEDDDADPPEPAAIAAKPDSPSSDSGATSEPS